MILMLANYLRYSHLLEDEKTDNLQEITKADSGRFLEGKTLSYGSLQGEY